MRRILVVRLGAMGDIIHALPAVASLARTGMVSWAVEQRWAPLLEGNPHLEHVVPVGARSLSNALALRRELRRLGFDAAVDLQGLIKSAVVARLSGAPIYGFDRAAAREPLATWLYKRQVKPSGVHVVDRYIDVALGVGAPGRVYEFPLPPGRPEGTLPTTPFVLANPLAGWRSKQWPVEYYSELARMLRARGIALVLNAAQPVEVAGAESHVSGLAGLIDATRRATAIVGVDSGPLHLAAAMSKLGVAIFGPTDPARNGPYGGTFRVLRSKSATTSYKRRDDIDPSMRAITPTQVFSELERVLPA
jgi:heptosyltransferase-1